MAGIHKVHHQQGDSRSLAVDLLKRGQAHQQADQLKDSVRDFETALQLFRVVGSRYYEWVTLSHIEEVRWAMKQHELTQNYRQPSQVITQDLEQLTPERKRVGTRLHAIGLVYHHQGEYAQALDSLQQALAINQKIGDQEGEG